MNITITQGSRVLAETTGATIEGTSLTTTAFIGLSEVKALGREACTLIVDGTTFEATLSTATTYDNSNELVREFVLTFETAAEIVEEEKPKRKRKAKTEEVETPCDDCEVPCDDCPEEE